MKSRVVQGVRFLEWFKVQGVRFLEWFKVQGVRFLESIPFKKPDPLNFAW